MAVAARLGVDPEVLWAKIGLPFQQGDLFGRTPEQVALSIAHESRKSHALTKGETAFIILLARERLAQLKGKP